MIAAIPAWYQRMSKRERVLGWIVAGGLFGILNLVIWSMLFGAIGRARTELNDRRVVRKTQAVFMNERELWKKREAWLKAHQPILRSPSEASTLLDHVKEIAAKYNVQIMNPAIGTGESGVDHQSVFASVETQSPWGALVHFLYDVQQPESFIVFENVSLAIDGGDKTMMHGRFKIARWFAPTAQR